MGDPWKSVTPKGVSAFVNASTSVILFWIAFESSLATVLGIHIAYISFSITNFCLSFTEYRRL